MMVGMYYDPEVELVADRADDDAGHVHERRVRRHARCNEPRLRPPVGRREEDKCTRKSRPATRPIRRPKPLRSSSAMTANRSLRPMMGRRASGNSSLKSASVLRGLARRAVQRIPDQPAGSPCGRPVIVPTISCENHSVKSGFKIFGTVNGFTELGRELYNEMRCGQEQLRR